MEAAPATQQQPLQIIHEPALYLVGRQTLDHTTIDRFLAAYNAQAAPFEWRKRVVHRGGLKKYYGDLRH